MYPSFSKLVTGVGDPIGAPFDMLEGDTLQEILSSASLLGDETCDTVLGVCSVNHPLHDQCNEVFFERASGRMGFGSPEGGGEGQPPAPSWREFFAKSCRWLRRAREATGLNSQDFYAQTLGFDPVGKWAILRVHPMLLEHLSANRSDYSELSRLAVVEDGKALRYVPKNRTDYGELARIAVAQDGRALQSVPTDRLDYGEIARIAVAKNGDALEEVPVDRLDYGALARIAVAENAWALLWVPDDRPDYGEIARIAVAESAWALHFVPRNHPDFDEIARLAE